MNLKDIVMNENVFPVLVIGGAYCMAALPYFYARHIPGARSSFNLVSSNELGRINKKQKIASVMYGLFHPIKTYSKLRGKPDA